MTIDDSPNPAPTPEPPSTGALAWERRIRDHNRYNGTMFSALEFGVVALTAGGFGIAYAVAGRWVLAAVGIGIAVNCVPTVAWAIAARRAGEPEIGWRGLRDPAVREAIRRTHPHLLRDTLLITVCTVLPYVGLILILGERRSSRSRTTRRP